MRTKTWLCPLYGFNISVLQGSAKQATKLVAQKWHQNVKLNGLRGYTLHLEDRGANVLVVWASTKAALVHELLHAAVLILDHVGVPIRADNDEVLAYYLEYLYTKVVEQK